jgi:Tyrosine phosphatase family
MEALDPAWVQSQLSSPPFVTIEGVSNVRSLGNYASGTLVGHFTRPNFMFRAGEISGITSTGKQQLQQLGIYPIYDPKVLHAIDHAQA